MAAKCMKEIISELKDIILVEKVVTIKTKMTEENKKENDRISKRNINIIYNKRRKI